jgi:hypothetical protein
VFFNAYERFTDGVGQPTKRYPAIFSERGNFMPLAFEMGALYVFRSRTFCAYMHYGSREYAAFVYIAKITSPIQVAGTSPMKII